MINHDLDQPRRSHPPEDRQRPEVPPVLGRLAGWSWRLLVVLGAAGLGLYLLTLIAIPTFYEILDEWRSAFARRFGMKVKQQTAEYPVPGMASEAGD